MITLAKCCNPMRGEEIVGYITRGKGVSVHSAHCPNVAQLMYDSERRIDVEWDAGPDAASAVRRQARARRRGPPGAARQDRLGRSPTRRPTSATSRRRRSKTTDARITIVVAVADRKQMDRVMAPASGRSTVCATVARLAALSGEEGGAMREGDSDAGRAPRAVGPYSQAIVADGLRLGLGSDRARSGDGNARRRRGRGADAPRAGEPRARCSKPPGSGLDRVVRATVYLVDMDDFEAMNRVYAELFPSDPPARVCVEVSPAPEGGRVEIDAVADSQLTAFRTAPVAQATGADARRGACRPAAACTRTAGGSAASVRDDTLWAWETLCPNTVFLPQISQILRHARPPP